MGLVIGFIISNRFLGNRLAHGIVIMCKFVYTAKLIQIFLKGTIKKVYFSIKINDFAHDLLKFSRSFRGFSNFCNVRTGDPFVMRQHAETYGGEYGVLEIIDAELPA